MWVVCGDHVGCIWVAYRRHGLPMEDMGCTWEAYGLPMEDMCRTREV